MRAIHLVDHVNDKVRGVVFTVPVAHENGVSIGRARMVKLPHLPGLQEVQ
jgi:hypothetical protein